MSPVAEWFILRRDMQYCQILLHISLIAHLRAQILDSRRAAFPGVQSDFILVLPRAFPI